MNFIKNFMGYFVFAVCIALLLFNYCIAPFHPAVQTTCLKLSHFGMLITTIIGFVSAMFFGVLTAKSNIDAYKFDAVTEVEKEIADQVTILENLRDVFSLDETQKKRYIEYVSKIKEKYKYLR